MENKIDSVTTNISECFFRKISVGNIVFPNGDKRYRYNPKEDITAYEVSRLLLMFYFAVTNNYYTIDYYSYIQEHKLERHFDEVKQ